MFEIGKKIFVLKGCIGDDNELKLFDYKGCWVVIYFYFKDSMLGCIIEV